MVAAEPAPAHHLDPGPSAGSDESVDRAAPVPQSPGGYYVRVVSPCGGTRKVRLGQRERASPRAAREAGSP
eukprot:11749361-Alexandrium_andersonii.AAC.1